MSDRIQDTPAPTKKRAWWRWLVALAFLVLGGVQILRGVDVFRLPSCDSQNALDTVRSIFAGKDAPLTKIENAKLVAENDKQRDCSAYVETADEKAEITYHVFWDGWSKGVMIDNVTPVAAAPGQS